MLVQARITVEEVEKQREVAFLPNCLRWTILLSLPLSLDNRNLIMPSIQVLLLLLLVAPLSSAAQ